MKNKTFYILRHAETQMTKTHIEYPIGQKNWEFPILEEGRPAIKKLANFLKNKNIQSFYTSEFKRTQVTSKIVSEIINVKPQPVNLFNEYEKYTEDFDEVDTRTDQATEFLMHDQAERIAVCTHGSIIAALRYKILDKKFTEANIKDYTLPGELIIIKDKKEEVISFN